jgi:Helicase conserved C-terminal domain
LIFIPQQNEANLHRPYIFRAGAVGINLTQANHVFIMEPSFNPALEAQAIGRVHRLGQKRNVDIVRMIMADSVEIRIRSMLEKKYGAGAIGSGENIEAAPESDDVGEYDGDKKPAAKLPIEVEVAVGSLRVDKAAVVEEEFDLLFGIVGGTKAAEDLGTLFDEDDGTGDADSA